jgi:hypothetical protein
MGSQNYTDFRRSRKRTGDCLWPAAPHGHPLAARHEGSDLMSTGHGADNPILALVTLKRQGMKDQVASVIVLY